MKPTPVLGTQLLIGPLEEVTLFLGTGHKLDRGSGWNDSVEAWRVHGKSTANNTTCPTLRDEVDYTQLSYTQGLDLAHKTANTVEWDI